MTAVFSRRLVGQCSQPLAMEAGIGVLMLGTLLTLIPHLGAVIAGLFVNAIGFFLPHPGRGLDQPSHLLRPSQRLGALPALLHGGATLGGSTKPRAIRH